MRLMAPEPVPVTLNGRRIGTLIDSHTDERGVVVTIACDDESRAALLSELTGTMSFATDVSRGLGQWHTSSWWVDANAGRIRAIGNRIGYAAPDAD